MNTNRLTSLFSFCFLVVSVLTLVHCELGGAPPVDCSDLECKEGYEVKIEDDDYCACHCAPGWGGPDCTEPAEGNCATLHCFNGGNKLKDGDFCFCSCAAGWGGTECNIPISACPGVECPEGQEPNPSKDCVCE